MEAAEPGRGPLLRRQALRTRQASHRGGVSRGAQRKRQRLKKQRREPLLLRCERGHRGGVMFSWESIVLGEGGESSLFHGPVDSFIPVKEFSYRFNYCLIVSGWKKVYNVNNYMERRIEDGGE